MHRFVTSVIHKSLSNLVSLSSLRSYTFPCTCMTLDRHDSSAMLCTLAVGKNFLCIGSGFRGNHIVSESANLLDLVATPLAVVFVKTGVGTKVETRALKYDAWTHGVVP